MGQFILADLVYCHFEMSSAAVETLIKILSRFFIETAGPITFQTQADMNSRIDASTLGDVPWKHFLTRFSGNIDEHSPAWKQTGYNIWYRDPDAVIAKMLADPDLSGQFDLRPFIELDTHGRRRWSNVMSGNIAWQRSVSTCP